jgi:hypothetical protein
MKIGEVLHKGIVGTPCVEDDTLYCCYCEAVVQPDLMSGEQIYPHRKDLWELPFWQCPACGNYVGCHHKTNNPLKPLGNIPSKEMRTARGHIHYILDNLWKSGKYKRGYLYGKISHFLGYEYHTGELKTLEEARKVYTYIKTEFYENKLKSGKYEHTR